MTFSYRSSAASDLETFISSDFTSLRHKQIIQNHSRSTLWGPKILLLSLQGLTFPWPYWTKDFNTSLIAVFWVSCWLCLHSYPGYRFPTFKPCSPLGRLFLAISIRFSLQLVLFHRLHEVPILGHLHLLLSLLCFEATNRRAWFCFWFLLFNLKEDFSGPWQCLSHFWLLLIPSSLQNLS